MAGRPPQLRWAQVMAWRADRHQLAGRAPAGSMLELAARVAGLHAQVTRRFLAASGPVTREDFARWWGIPSPARVEVEVEGTAAHRPAAAGLRPVRGHRHPPGRPPDAGPVKAFTGGRLELTWAGA